jgi:hypothetical protein
MLDMLSNLYPLLKFNNVIAIFILPLVAMGCVRIPVAQHQDLSRPNMTFESQGAFASRPAVFGQTEPGSATSGGGQAAGCTACQ